MARARTYAREYRARLRRARGLPKAVARGHGPVPIALARKIEAAHRGKRGAITGREIRENRAGVVAYEKKYHGKTPRLVQFRHRFSSRRAAEKWVKEKKIPMSYVLLVNRPGGRVDLYMVQ